MNKKSIIFKTPGKEPEVMEVDAKYRIDLKHLVPNADIIEHSPIIPMEDGTVLMMLVDEDGHPKGLPFNFYIASPNKYFPVQMIVGHCVITKFKPDSIFEDDYDYQIESLTAEEIEYVQYWFQSEVQKELKCDFDKMYPDMKSYLQPIVRDYDAQD